jgi:hypothetical protein
MDAASSTARLYYPGSYAAGGRCSYGYWRFS